MSSSTTWKTKKTEHMFYLKTHCKIKFVRRHTLKLSFSEGTLKVYM